MFKRIIALLLVLIMLLGTVACNDKDVTSKNDGTSSVGSEVSDDTSSDKDATDSSDDITSSDTNSDNKTNNNSSKKEPTMVTSTYTEKVEDVINLDVDNSKVVNSNWGGVNAIHQGFMYLPDEYGRDYNDAQIAEELKRMDEMDINMVRSYMDAGYAFQYRNGKEITYDWNSERMQAFYKWLDAMEERDIEVAVQMGWNVGSVANATTKDALGYTIPWYVSGQLNIYGEMIDMYTDWVELFIKEVIIKRGYDIEYLVMFTEPYHFNEYTFYVDYDYNKETKNGWEVSVDLIRATDKALKEAGLRDMVKLTGPQYGLSSKFYEGETLEEELDWWISRIDECIDVYTFHWYVPTWPGEGSSSNASVFDDNYDLWLYYLGEVKRIVGKTGKPFWFDEWNYGGQAMENQKTDFYGQQIAQTVIAGMNAGIDSMLYWQLFETVWPTRFDTGGEFEKGIHILGTAPSLYESAIPYKLYYGFSLLAKYAGEKGSTIYSGSNKKGICCSMVEYEKDGKKYQNVIVVNTTSLEQKISLNFEKGIGKDMYRYLFDPITTVPNTGAEMISADKGFTNVNDILQDTIPAGSIVVYSTVKD
ncbi:MAG: hypothetical protein IJN56_08605 [Clostridia bacterium]|nr:hypothetical protein [Clostridia bacterium]